VSAYWARDRAREPAQLRRSDSDDRAGEGSDNPGDRLDLCDHKMAECIDIGSFGRNDDIVWAGDGFR